MTYYFTELCIWRLIYQSNISNLISGVKDIITPSGIHPEPCSISPSVYVVNQLRTAPTWDSYKTERCLLVLAKFVQRNVKVSSTDGNCFTRIETVQESLFSNSNLNILDLNTQMWYKVLYFIWFLFVFIILLSIANSLLII